MEAYVTLAEAAELEGIGYDTMKKRVQRTPAKFCATPEQRSGGGKELVTVAVSCLSRKARAAYKEREKIRAMTVSPEDAVPDAVEADQPLEDAAPDTGPAEQAQPPWYVGEDVDWFMNHHKKEWYKAMELGNVVRDFLDYDEKGRCKYADSFAKERLGKDKRTLYRYTKAYLEACAWADRLERQDGCNYDFLKVLCLCRKPKDSGTFPSFTPEVKQAIKNIWFNRDFAANQGTREMLYEKLTLLAQINNWEKIPSYQSVVRYIHYLMEDEGMKNAWYLASRGEREYKNKVMGKALMDTTRLQPMEVVMGDEHTFDCWVAYTHPNGKVTPIKPVLVAWVDVRSRRIIGDVICRKANSDILKESMLKLIFTEDCGVPKYLLIDNGKDYTAEVMTGLPRNKRSSDELDDVTKGFYRSLGIQEVHRALPYQPWTKGQIERFFGGVCSRFTKWFRSYTGTLTGSRTDAKISKDIQKMCDNGELLTMEEFYEKWSEWLREKYEKTVHRGLKDAGEQYTKPIELFDNVGHYYMPAPPREYCTMLMYRCADVRIYNYGFKRNGLVYDAPELRLHLGELVDIKYDKNDISTIYVFAKDGSRICNAKSAEMLAFGEHVSEEVLRKHNKEQNRQLRDDRKRLEKANVPFEKMNEQYIGFSSSVGGIDLMIGSKAKPPKVVSMPQDATYRNGFRSGRKEETEEENEYISRQAEEALKKLRAL